MSMTQVRMNRWVSIGMSLSKLRKASSGGGTSSTTALEPAADCKSLLSILTATEIWMLWLLVSPDSFCSKTSLVRNRRRGISENGLVVSILFGSFMSKHLHPGED